MKNKKRWVGILLSAVIVVSLSLSVAAVGLGPRMSLSSAAQSKQVATGRKLSDAQYQALYNESMQLFDFPEVSASKVDRKEMRLELDVVGQTSAGLKEKLEKLEKEYGIDSELHVVEGYESAELPSANDLLENNKAFAEQLKQQLGKESYTDVAVTDSTITVEVPSVESIEKAEKLRQSFAKQRELSPIQYVLCRYSCQQLEQAKATVDKELAGVAEQDGGSYSVRINGGYLELYCPYGRSEQLESYLAKSSYRAMLVVLEGRKPLLDGAGL